MNWIMVVGNIVGNSVSAKLAGGNSMSVCLWIALTLS